MRIKPEISAKYAELEIHVCKNREDEEARRVLEELHALYDTSLPATDERGNRRRLMPKDLVSFFAEGQRVFAMGAEGRYVVSKKLYELESELANAGFVRISKSELVNVRKIRSLDLSVMGTIRVIMCTGYETYTSRRNVAKIKALLLGEKE